MRDNTPKKGGGKAAPAKRRKNTAPLPWCCLPLSLPAGRAALPLTRRLVLLSSLLRWVGVASPFGLVLLSSSFVLVVVLSSCHEKTSHFCTRSIHAPLARPSFPGATNLFPRFPSFIVLQGSGGGLPKERAESGHKTQEEEEHHH